MLICDKCKEPIKSTKNLVRTIHGCTLVTASLEKKYDSMSISVGTLILHLEGDVCLDCCRIIEKNMKRDLCIALETYNSFKKATT